MDPNQNAKFEILLAAVDRAGANLLFAIQACVEAGLPAGRFRIEAAKSGGDTKLARDWIAEQLRPKGPMVTIKAPGRRGAEDRTYTAEVEKITDASIILRGGSRFRRDNGLEVGGDRWYPCRIEPEEMARIVATGWKAPPNGKQKLA